MRFTAGTALGVAGTTIAVVLFVVGCQEGESSDDSETVVVASTNHPADIAQNIAGDRASVTGIAPVNADPHDFEPVPSDVQRLAGADLILKSGGELDEWLDELIESSESDARVETILDSVAPMEVEHAEHEDDAETDEGIAAEADEHDHPEGEIDPHWWQDPRNAIVASEAIRDELIEIDPEGEEVYAQNAENYIAELERLDGQIAACMEAIPAGDRTLVTTHDALGYFADRYDIEVIGSLVPALTTQAQPSLGETQELIDLIESQNVKAVFPEAGLNASLEEAVTEETGAEVGGELWSDTLGPADSTGATYLDAMSHNASTMASGFTGEERSCEITGADD